jgi:hypothetical protein
VVPPALDAIRVEDLRRDLFTLAGDAMRGRRAGTLDELRASVWLAEQARAAGLEPAGEDGTYFQFWPMRRVLISEASRVRIGERGVRLGEDAYVVAPVNASVTGPVTWIGLGTEADLTGRELRGRIVALELSAPARMPAPGMSLYRFRYTIAALTERARALAARGVAAILVVSDTVAESEMRGFTGDVLARGRYSIDSGATVLPSGPAVVWVSRAYLDALRANPAPTASLAVDYDSYVYPSVNVVARVRGTDPRLRDEYVLFSAHQDHDGIRRSRSRAAQPEAGERGASPVSRTLPGQVGGGAAGERRDDGRGARARGVDAALVVGDSIYNGADDNGSTSVALLAIGRAFARHPGRRSALFVWHGAEERGLLGSRWHAWHPVVPRDQIVAVLNGDMIGGNAPDTAGLLGVQRPHLDSPDLARMALDANARITHFVIDSSWDRPGHPEFWYFRSDHVPYARHHIPVVYFSTLPHARYHTPADRPETIDFAKLAQMTRWMYATGWAAATADQRPRREPGFTLER